MGKEGLFNLRAFIVGAVLCFLIGFGDPYGMLIIRRPSMTLDMSSPGAVFLFFVLVGVVNVILRAIKKSLALKQGGVADCLYHDDDRLCGTQPRCDTAPPGVVSALLLHHPAKRMGEYRSPLYPELNRTAGRPSPQASL